MTTGRVLFVMTASDHLTLKDGTRHRTGFWAEEFAEPFERFEKAGLAVDIATPGGAPSPVDPASLTSDHLRDVVAHMPKSQDLAGVKASDYDAIFIPGGHGPLEDLAVSPAMGNLLNQARAAGTLVAAVCHGPAALLPAMELYRGYKLTSFSHAEEDQTPVAKTVPFELEDRLKAGGAHYSSGPLWAPYVVEDRDLITGQNPASSGLIADTVLARLKA